MLAYDKLELKLGNLVFTSLHFKEICHGVKLNAKICAIGITECNKMLGRALDPRANGVWLSKLTE